MRALIILTLCLASVLANQITIDPTAYTLKFTQSVTNFNVWTAPATRRIRNTDTTTPSNTGSALPISAAMNELESFQVIIAPTPTASFTVSLAAFPNVGPTGWIDIGKAVFAAPSVWGQGSSYTVTDTTVPVAQGGTVTLSATTPTVLWITILIPQAGTTAGPTTSNLVLTPAGGSAINIPINLYIFSFAIDISTHFKGMMFGQPIRCPQTSIGCSSVAQLDPWKTVYLQHRMTPNAVAWPAGLNYEVSWDCQTHTFDPQPTSGCEYANGCLTQRYGLGKGTTWDGTAYPDWLGTGFPNFMAQNTDSGRPDICGISCGSTWYCSAAYETEWGNYLRAMYSYAQSINISSKVFWYTQNEPQNWNDYNAAAHTCAMAKTAEPNLKIAVTKGARPEIAENPYWACPGYDIWVAHLSNYLVPYIWDRQEQFGEESWIYTLDTDALCAPLGSGQTVPICGPTFAPAVSNTGNNGAENPIAGNDGPHYRIIPWVSWVNRITGWGYYKDEIFWDEAWANVPQPSRPRISAALLREGLEDYEYLYLANGGSYPQVYVKYPVDDTAMSLGFCFHVWNKNPDAFHAIRHELGLKIEGTRLDFPYLQAPYVHPYGSYYINFQNASGTNFQPFSFNGTNWIPIGWDAYDVSRGFGWCSQYSGIPNYIQPSTVDILSYVDTGSGNRVERDIMFDNFNHPDVFYFSIEPGIYRVTIAVGWMGSCRNGDTEWVSANGVILRAFNCSACACQNVREYGANVYVKGNNLLVITVGSSYDSYTDPNTPPSNGYTILSYLKIEAVSTLPPSVATTTAAVSTSFAASTTTIASATATAAGNRATTTLASTTAVTANAAATGGSVGTTTAAITTTNAAVVSSTTNAVSTTAVTSTAFAAGGSTGTTTAAASTTTEATTLATTTTASTTAVTSTAFAAGGATATTTAATTTAAAASAGSSRSGKNLSGGAIAGIVIAVLIVLAIVVAALVYFLVYRRSQSGGSSTPNWATGAPKKTDKTYELTI